MVQNPGDPVNSKIITRVLFSQTYAKFSENKTLVEKSLCPLLI